MATTKVVDAPEGVDAFARTQPIAENDPFFAPEPEPQTYEPTMDPGSPLWNPQKYFGAQEKITIILNKTRSDMLSDASGKKRIVMKVSINGYEIPIAKGIPTRVPKDFALHLVDIGAASFFSDYEDAQRV